MRKALIRNSDGLVENIIEADEDFVPPNSYALRPAEAADIGHTWNGSEFVAPPPPVPPLPAPLSARQIRLALAMNGLLANVDSAIATLPEPNRTLAKIEWEYATQFKRDNPMLLQIGAAIGLSAEQIDQMWQHGLAL